MDSLIVCCVHWNSIVLVLTPPLFVDPCSAMAMVSKGSARSQGDATAQSSAHSQPLGGSFVISLHFSAVRPTFVDSASLPSHEPSRTEPNPLLDARAFSSHPSRRLSEVFLLSSALPSPSVHHTRVQLPLSKSFGDGQESPSPNQSRLFQVPELPLCYLIVRFVLTS